VLGGIPYYWHFLEQGKSVAQNIDEMFFAGSDKLENEFDELYASLFKTHEPYVQVVTALAVKKVGMTREQLSRASGLPETGRMSAVLDDLERCGFVRKYVPMGKVNRGAVYQLMDNFTLFYFRFVKPNHGIDRHYWTKMLPSSVHAAWVGLAFERLCLQHLEQIKGALQIRGVITTEHALYAQQAQVDLLIDRNDGIVNVCEMKFSDGKYEILKKEHEAMRNRLRVVRQETGTRKALHTTFVTSCGLVYNAYANDVQSQVVLDDLFAF